MAERPHLVIVGAGFAGLYCARALKNAPVRITVLDRQNHHLFQPLLYQVATATLAVGEIAAPIRHVLRKQRNVEVLLGDVKAIDPVARKVLLVDRSISYDQCLLAAGTTHSYFGHPEWARWAPGLKTLEDAIEIRRRILMAFEMAERESDPARQRAWLTFVVVGAGPTGVELAGALTEIARFSMGGDFRRIAPEAARVVLVEAAPRVLPPFAEPLSEKARRQLEKIGVEVRTGTPVSRIDATGVTLGAEHVAAHTVLWGAGVAASPVARSLGVALDRAGRVRVMPDLTVPGYPELYVAGDLAAIGRDDGRPVPGVAPAAIQMGRHVARDVVRSLRGEPREPFRYWDKGSLATIGRADAVAEFAGVRLSGLVAWLAWLLVHIYFLIGFRNRLAVLAHWAWSYVTFDRGSRLITDTASHARVQALEAEEAEAAAIARRRRREA